MMMINCFHFVWYPQSNEILLNLGMKCQVSAFHAQEGLRLIIVPVHVRAVKIYVAVVEVVLKTG